MSSAAVDSGLGTDVPRHELQKLRHNWGWFLVMGIAMVALGTFAISWACTVTLTLTATWMFGFFILASGIMEIVNSFWAGKWSGTLLHLLIGVLYAVVGVLIIDQPLEAAVSMTLIIAMFLIISGIFRMAFAIVERFHGRGWVLINGVISLMLGVLIYKQWPASGLWVIGLFIGIELLMNGWGWIMMALALRGAKPAAEANAAT